MHISIFQTHFKVLPLFIYKIKNYQHPYIYHYRSLYLFVTYIFTHIHISHFYLYMFVRKLGSEHRFSNDTVMPPQRHGSLAPLRLEPPPFNQFYFCQSIGALCICSPGLHTRCSIYSYLFPTPSNPFPQRLSIHQLFKCLHCIRYS